MALYSAENSKVLKRTEAIQYSCVNKLLSTNRIKRLQTE